MIRTYSCSQRWKYFFSQCLYVRSDQSRWLFVTFSCDLCLCRAASVGTPSSLHHQLLRHVPHLLCPVQPPAGERYAHAAPWLWTWPLVSPQHHHLTTIKRATASPGNELVVSHVVVPFWWSPNPHPPLTPCQHLSVPNSRHTFTHFALKPVETMTNANAVLWRANMLCCPNTAFLCPEHPARASWQHAQREKFPNWRNAVSPEHTTSHESAPRLRVPSTATSHVSFCMYESKPLLIFTGLKRLTVTFLQH